MKREDGNEGEQGSGDDASVDKCGHEAEAERVRSGEGVRAGKGFGRSTRRETGWASSRMEDHSGVTDSAAGVVESWAASTSKMRS